MQPIPAPEPYTLPLTLRIDRRSFIITSILFLPFIAAPLHFAASIASTVADTAAVALFLLFAAFISLLYLHIITYEIRLTEESISNRGLLLGTDMEYTRITAVRFYYTIVGDLGGKIPMLELSGDAGPAFTINLGMVSPSNHGIIYDVLKKKAVRAGISKSQNEFFIDPTITAWRGNMLLQPYLLPLTLRVSLNFFITVSVIILPVIAYIVYLAAFANPQGDVGVLVFYFLIAACFSLVYLACIMPAIHLTEDRITYRKRFFSKEMEYRKLTAVRFYYRDTWTGWTSGPMLELSGDTGDTMTISFCTFISPAHLPVIYDVLKKKAPQAGLRNSPGVFFAHPDTTVRS